MKIRIILGIVLITVIFFISSCDSPCFICIENQTGNVLLETCNETQALEFEERSFNNGIIVNCAEM